MRNEEQQRELLKDANRRILENLPGYPWLPCPICKGIEGCDHNYWERARSANPGLTL